VLDEGQWWDLGSRTQYLAAHAALNGMHGPAIHPEARVSPDAILRRTNVIGPGAIVESGCQLEDCILWPDAKVVTGARLTRCIVRSHITAAGTFEDVDF
jgi:NDP-sugar pyrophosphorylase family protein